MTKINVPRLRFREFNEEWKCERLSKNISLLNGLTYSPKDVNSDGTFVIRSSNVKDDNLIDNDNVYVNPKVVNSENVKQGDIVVVVRNGSRALIGKHAIVNKNMTNTVVGAFMTLIRTENGRFYNALLSTDLFKKEVHKALGATINQITKKDFGLMDFFFPNYDEEQRIGSFFAKIDKLIELQTQKLEQLKKLKRGYLQNMFPQDGESVPRLRFSGFSDEWKEKKLSELVDISTGFPFKSSNFDEDGNFTVITNKSIHSNKKFVLNNGDKIRLNKGYNKYILEKGDILITMDGNVGISAVVNDQDMILAQRVARISYNDKFSDYIFAFLNSNNFISGINKISIGSIIKHISLNDIKEFKCFIPDEEEIIKIGNFFNKIDSLIVSESDYLEILKQQKKAYLQKMFI